MPKVSAPLVAVPIVCAAAPLIVTVPLIVVALATPPFVILPFTEYVPAPLNVADELPTTRFWPNAVMVTKVMISKAYMLLLANVLPSNDFMI